MTPEIMDAKPRELQLVERAKTGDRRAFALLVERHGTRLRALVESRMRARGIGERTTGDDVLQETVARALARIARFQWRGGDSFVLWLGGIAEKVILESVRAQRRDPSLFLGDRPSDGPSPSRVVRREERFDRLKAALETLSPERRRVVELARLDGLRLVEIAARMGRSPGATKKLLHRALGQLRQAFGDTESVTLPDRSLREEDVADATE